MMRLPFRAMLTRLVFLLSMLLLSPACVDSKPTIEEQDACFEEYIDTYKEDYPEATLQKTAALKCYQ
jgi:hypothetical protein